MSLKIVEQSLREGKSGIGDPLAVGQFTAVNLVLRQLAPQEDFIPQPEKLKNEFDSHDILKWMREIHSAMMMPITLDGEKRLDRNVLPKHLVGSYRSSRKVLGPRAMPNPLNIKRLLHSWLLDVAQFNKEMAYKLKHPFMLSKMDIQNIADHAYQAHLRICCIKPFEDGSNRLARLIENSLRLNWGLPWKIIPFAEKDKLLNDIFEMQKKYPENV